MNLEELKAKLEKAEKSIKSSFLKSNPIILDAVKIHIENLKKQIIEYGTEKSESNFKILDTYYRNNKTFLTKEELIEKGFDFSEWFSTSNLKHYFDIHENSFEFTDFKCGKYYVKTRDKNLENPSIKARVFFQIIRLEFDRNSSEYLRIIKLLKQRKYLTGHLWAYRYDSEMRDESNAINCENDLKEVNMQIEKVIPIIKDLVNSLKHTQEVFKDLHDRLNSKETQDENW
jgi:hypothetical protein